MGVINEREKVDVIFLDKKFHRIEMTKNMWRREETYIRLFEKP